MSSGEKPRRKPIQIYVPRHRRAATTADESPGPKPENSSRLSTASSRLDSPNQQEDVVRRGRGQFRAPSGSASPTVNEPSPSPSPPPADAISLTVETELVDAMANLDLRRSPSSSPKEDWEDSLDDDDDSEEEQDESRTRVKSPKTSTSTPKMGEPIEQLTTILECSGFPASFKTHHIFDLFRIYEDMPGGFKLKWMDDTRVLVLFGNAATAKKAYLDNIANPQAKIVPYTGPVEFVTSPKGEPIPQRPMTTSMVARRLVHGALGMRGPTRTAEERQAERDMLQAVRDQREAKKQQAARSEQAITDAFYDE